MSLEDILEDIQGGSSNPQVDIPPLETAPELEDHRLQDFVEELPGNVTADQAAAIESALIFDNVLQTYTARGLVTRKEAMEAIDYIAAASSDKESRNVWSLKMTEGASRHNLNYLQNLKPHIQTVSHSNSDTGAAMELICKVGRMIEDVLPKAEEVLLAVTEFVNYIKTEPKFEHWKKHPPMVILSGERTELNLYTMTDDYVMSLFRVFGYEPYACQSTGKFPLYEKFSEIKPLVQYLLKSSPYYLCNGDSERFRVLADSMNYLTNLEEALKTTIPDLNVKANNNFGAGYNSETEVILAAYRTARSQGLNDIKMIKRLHHVIFDHGVLSKLRELLEFIV